MTLHPDQRLHHPLCTGAPCTLAERSSVLQARCLGPLVSSEPRSCFNILQHVALSQRFAMILRHFPILGAWFFWFNDSPKR